MSKKLFLIDGTALAYRSYFAMMRSNLRNADGIPTGSIFGFANTLYALFEKEKPDYLAVAWDTKAPTFRHEMDENYKANRPPQPEDLRIAIPIIKEMVELFGSKNLEKDGYEADDIIGTIAMETKNENLNVYMVTSDKDFMQLVGDNIYMYKPRNREDGFDVIDDEGVMTYFGVKPDAVVDILALIGDTSDNVPGVPGIGKKGAAKIIQEYGSLEKAIQEAPYIKNKRAREGLMEHKELALKSREMITINTQVPDTLSWKELEWEGMKNEPLHEFFKRMQFRTLMRKITRDNTQQETEKEVPAERKIQGNLFDDGETLLQKEKEFYAGGQTAPSSQIKDVNEKEKNEERNSYQTIQNQSVDYRSVMTQEALEKCLNELKKAPLWSFDTETTSTNPHDAALLGIAFSCKKGEAWYIVADKFSQKKLISALLPLFQQKDTLKIAHHFKYDYVVLNHFGITFDGPLFDTMLAAYLIDAGQKLDMNTLARTYLNYDPLSIESLIGEKGKKQRSMSEVPIEKVITYACEDADITLRLYHQLEKNITKTGLEKLACHMEFPLAKILGNMEISGIKLDLGLLGSFSDQLNSDIDEVRDAVFFLAGETFNINSTKQLGEVLFEKMKLPSQKKTSGGRYSTSEQVLSRLAGRYEIIDRILDYRKLSKLKSTYVDALPRLVSKRSGRIHTTYNQHITSTGRLSSNQPNLQNIPVRTERGREIRKAFVADKGYQILAADYSQIELRIIASMSGDKAMITAFQDDEDIHARTAAEIFGLDTLDGVDREQRRKAKEVNFGIPYGISAFGLSQRIGISNKEASEIIKAYYDRFPSIQQFITETIEFARDKGYVETLFGRRRYIPDIYSENFNIRSFAERTAVNMPIQGTAADLIKIAMIKIDSAFKEMGSKTRMLMQVHDELIFEVPDDEIQEIPNRVIKEMEEAMELRVPLKVETGLAENWLDAH